MVATETDLDDVIDSSGIDLSDGELSTEVDEVPAMPETKASSVVIGHGYRRDISRFLFVDIETVPDWDRLDLFDLDIPNKPRARTPIDKCPDIAVALEKTIEEIKLELRMTWPCSEWLGLVLDAETKRAKPRAGVRDAVKSIISEMDADLNAESAFIKKLSVNPQYCKIAALGMAVGDDPVNGLIGDERAMLQRFWSLACVSSHIVGFNHCGFDLPVILVRSMILGVKPTRKLDISPWSDSCLDLMVKIFGKGPAIGMKRLAGMYGLPIDEEGVDGSQVHKLIVEDPEKVRRYVMSDVMLTRNLFRKIEGYFV